MGGMRIRAIADLWHKIRQNKRTQDAVKGKKPFGRLPEPEKKKEPGAIDMKSKAVVRAKVIRKDGTIEDLDVIAGNPNITPI